MKKLLHSFLHWIKVYRFPHYFSYYVGSSHHPDNEELAREQHNKTGSCEFCGFWRKVSSFNDIPLILQKNKNAWREHCDD